MSETEMKQIPIDESEVKDLLALSDRVKKVHETLGSLREQSMRYESILIQLRKGQRDWEAQMVEKYALGTGKDWKVDPENNVLVIPVVPEAQEEAEASVEAPACTCDGDNCECKKAD